MKLKAFAEWLKSIDFKIDSEEKGYVLAHFINSRYNPTIQAGLEMILNLDSDGHFRKVYDDITNIPFEGEERKEFKRIQLEFLIADQLGKFFIDKVNEKNKRKHRTISKPTKARRYKTTDGTEPQSHRYNTESYYQPMRTISASGLVTVDSRYAKLHEDYDDK